MPIPLSLKPYILNTLAVPAERDAPNLGMISATVGGMVNVPPPR